MKKAILVLLLLSLLFTSCSSGEDDSSATTGLFESIYTVYADTKQTHEFEAAKDYINTTGFAAEITEAADNAPYPNIVILDTDSDDYITINFYPANEDGEHQLMSVQYVCPVTSKYISVYYPVDEKVVFTNGDTLKEQKSFLFSGPLPPMTRR